MSGLEHFLGEVHAAVAGRLGTDQRAAPVDALAGEHAGELVPQALVLAEQVADLAGAHADVTGRHVQVGADVAVQLAHERLAEAHHFVVAFALGIEVRAALAAADALGGERDLLQAQNEILAGGGISDVDCPGQGAVGAGLRLLGAEQGVLDRGRAIMAERTELFKVALDVDDVIAHLLVAEGYATVEDVADAAIEDLQGVEGFDEDIATELQRRAKEFIEKRDAELATRLEELGVSEEVRATEGLTLAMLVALGDKGVKSLDDLADLASDELREIVGESAMDAETANAIIMKAREHWFPAEPAAEEAAKA